MLRNVIMKTAGYVDINNITVVKDTVFLCWVSPKTSKINYTLNKEQWLWLRPSPSSVCLLGLICPNHQIQQGAFYLIFQILKIFSCKMAQSPIVCLNMLKGKKKKKIEKEKRKEKWKKKGNRKKREKKERRKKIKRREKMRQNQQGGEREQHLVLQEDDHWWPCSYHSVYIVIKRKPKCIYLKDLRK